MIVNSKVESYLHYLLLKKGDLPEPKSRIDYYLQFLAKGGNKDELPIPISRMDEYLFELCKQGVIGGGSEDSLRQHVIHTIAYTVNWQPVIHNKLVSITLTKPSPLSKHVITTIKRKEGA